MPAQLPIVLGFAAYSGTGKTTLLTRLIPILKHRGWRVGVIKHSHHDFEIDKPGKDSFELRAAGGSPMMIVSPYRRALITEFAEHNDPGLCEQLTAFPCNAVDLVLVEGFRHEAFPKIELHRQGLDKPLLYPDDTNIIAIASDSPLPTPDYLPCLDLNHPDTIADFIVERFLRPIRD